MSPIALEILKKYWKYLLVLGACVASYIAGARLQPGKETIVFKDKIVEKVVEVEAKTTKRNKVTTIDKKTDGSSVTTITENKETTEKRQSEKNRKEVVDSKAKGPALAATGPAYSLGLSVQTPLALDPKRFDPHYRLELGRRMVGDLWVEASYGVQDHSIGLGVRYEF